MYPLAVQEWMTSTSERTRQLGNTLGTCAKAGDMVSCCGVLGAGKTTFIQGFAEGLGVGPEAYVRSPTFTLVHEYQGRYPLYHFDFYRLSCAAEVETIGFEEYRQSNGVVVVEWADKFPELLPTSRLEICIAITTSNRRTIRGTIYDTSYRRYLHHAAKWSCAT